MEKSFFTAISGVNEAKALLAHQLAIPVNLSVLENPQCSLLLAHGQPDVVNINSYRWKKHCRGLFELPIFERVQNLMEKRI